jgi:hypothetical protein
MSAPHLYKNEERSMGYVAVELWTLGLCLIIKNLMAVYRNRSDPRLRSVFVPRLLRWIRETEKAAQGLVQRTIRILDAEYAAERRAQKERITKPPVATVKPSSTTRSMAKATKAMKAPPADGTRKRGRPLAVDPLGKPQK